MNDRDPRLGKVFRDKLTGWTGTCTAIMLRLYGDDGIWLQEIDQAHRLSYVPDTVFDAARLEPVVLAPAVDEDGQPEAVAAAVVPRVGQVLRADEGAPLPPPVPAFGAPPYTLLARAQALEAGWLTVRELVERHPQVSPWVLRRLLRTPVKHGLAGFCYIPSTKNLRGVLINEARFMQWNAQRPALCARTYDHVRREAPAKAGK